MRTTFLIGGLAAWFLAAHAHAASEVTGCGTVTSNLTASKVLYVTPTAPGNGAGTSFSAPMSFSAALAAVSAGQMILLQPGKYAVSYTAGAKNTLTLSKSGTASANIHMVAANCGKAVIDFSFPTGAWVQDSFGFALSGSYWYFKGIEITRAGYQGVYVTGKNNTFENCAFYDNRNTGLEINKGGAYTTVLNSDAYRNYDPKKNGSMADGFGPKQTQGPGNRFIGCRAWENSDDGFCGTVASGEKHVFRNNVSLSAPQDICNATSTNNTWNSGLAAGTVDFAGLDLSLGTAARNPDGTLPSNSLFRLASGSKLVDKGVDAGLPFKGAAPDLGAFELR